MGGVGELTSLRPTGCIGVLTTLCAKAVRGYKTITPKMSAFYNIYPCYAPPGACQNRGRCPHPRSPRGRGAGDAYGLTPAPQPQSVGSPPTSKGCCYAVASQALTGFLLRPLRIVFLFPRRWKGVKGDVVVHFTLDALNRLQHSAQGMWIGFATCPCGLASEWGLGKAPRSLQIRPNNVI